MVVAYGPGVPGSSLPVRARAGSGSVTDRLAGDRLHRGGPVEAPPRQPGAGGLEGGQGGRGQGQLQAPVALQRVAQEGVAVAELGPGVAHGQSLGRGVDQHRAGGAGFQRPPGPEVGARSGGAFLGAGRGSQGDDEEEDQYPHRGGAR